MSIKRMTLEVPTTLARELDTADQEFLVEVLETGLSTLRIEGALKRYAAGGRSFGTAAREAGVSHSKLACQANARGMEPPFSEATIREELG